MLSSLQTRIARLVDGLPEAEEFALAGGAGLIVHGVIDRETSDLDLFATAASHVAAASSCGRTRRSCALDARGRSQGRRTNR